MGCATLFSRSPIFHGFPIPALIRLPFLQFDRVEPTTKLRPIDFPEFTTIDSIDRWTIWRLGVRNRLETRRDDSNVTWFELDTYFDVNFENPMIALPYSNLFNNIRFTPATMGLARH